MLTEFIQCYNNSLKVFRNYVSRVHKFILLLHVCPIAHLHLNAQNIILKSQAVVTITTHSCFHSI